MMKESEVMNNISIHEYIQAVVNVLFMKVYANKIIKLFGERSIADMIK